MSLDYDIANIEFKKYLLPTFYIEKCISDPMRIWKYNHFSAESPQKGSRSDREGTARGLAQLWPRGQFGSRRTTNLELAGTRGIRLFN